MWNAARDIFWSIVIVKVAAIIYHWLWIDCDDCERRGNEMFEKLQLDRFFPKKNFLESRRLAMIKKYLDDDEDNNDEDDDDDDDDEDDKDDKDDDDEEVDEEMLLRFNTCAVVSSAGSLKDSGLGAFIDSHDIVIRWNIVVKWNVIKIS